MRINRPHGLDFAMVRAESLERPATQQVAMEPGCPKRDGRMAQCYDIQGMHTFRRRVLVHGVQMQSQQGLDGRALQVVDPDVNGVQNRKYRCAIGRLTAGSQVSN